MRFLTAKSALTIWISYVFIAAAVQYYFSHTLYTDDAIASLLTQDFRLGYMIRNPPLWEWTLYSVQAVIGPGFESHLLVRYGFIALLGVAAFAASFAASHDAKWSAAVALGLPLFYAIGWGFFQRHTASLALVVICLFTFSVALRYVERPSFGNAFLFGALIGLGFLSKYNYSIFIFSFLFALFSLRESRVVILRRVFLSVPITAFIVLCPFLIWLWSIEADLVGLTQQNLVASEASYFSRILDGLARLLELAIGFLLPWALIAGVAAWRGRLTATEQKTQLGFGERLAGLTLLTSTSITAIGILILGVTKLNAAYTFPIFIAAVPYSAAFLSRVAPSTVIARAVAIVSISTLCAIVLIRLVNLSNSGFPEKSERRDMWPFAELASQMKNAGLDRGTLVTVSYREGGNLRASLPDLRVVTLEQTDATRPSRRASHADACRLLWNDTASLYPEAQWARSEESEVFAAFPRLASNPTRQFDVPWPPTLLGNQRVSRWKVIELEVDDPICR